MVDQAKINQTGRSSPRPAVARHVGEVAHSVVSLAELQARLLVFDLREGVRNSMPAAVAIATGAAILLSVFPLLFLALACALIDVWGAQRWLALVIAAGIALLCGLLIAIGGRMVLRTKLHVLERSQKELSENIRAIKYALQRNHSQTGGSDGLG